MAGALRRNSGLRWLTVPLVVGLLVLASCGGGDGGNAEGVKTVTAVSTVYTQSEEASETPESPEAAETTESEATEPEATEPNAPTEDTAPSLPPRRKDLTLAEFRQVDGKWEEGSYSVAGKEGIQGISAPLYMTEEATLELRLKNKYQKLKLTVGMDDDKTVDTSAKVNLSVNVNDKLQQTVPVAFNKENPLEFNVANANSVRLTFALGESVDFSEGAQVVLYQVQVD